MTSYTQSDYKGAGYLSAPETARRLGVKPATLYAYVSRGLVQAHRPSDSRTSLFHPEEVERLRARPARGARPELSIPSAVTLLRPDGLFYRGVDPLPLARTRTYEQVAGLLWSSALGPHRPWHPDGAAVEAAASAQRSLAGDALPLERLLVAAAAAAPTDRLRFDVTGTAVERAAPRLIASLAASLPERSTLPARLKLHGGSAASSVAGVLAARLSDGRPSASLIEAVNAALVLVADHELAASTMAVRIAAAARSPIYACIAAGLGVMQGPLHGGTSLWAEDLFAEISTSRGAGGVVEARLSRGDRLWGFGHPLYEDRDPRATALFELIRATAPARQRKNMEFLLAFAAEHALPPPNLDFALGALVHCWSLIRGSGQVVFAVGRMAGWIAHAIEEYERKGNYRIRATYTGRRPDGEPR